MEFNISFSFASILNSCIKMKSLFGENNQSSNPLLFYTIKVIYFIVIQMIIDGINYTGVSMEVYVAIQLVNGSKEYVTDKALSGSIANVIAKSNLTPEENEQVFDLTGISQDQRTEIMEIVESKKNRAESSL